MTGVISYPVPPYSNPPIEPQFFQPSRFDIANISFGQTTIVTTTTTQNYVVGQLVRLLIPAIFGSYQLNNLQGYVINILSSTQVEIDLISVGTTTFIPNPYTANITNITNSVQAVITANNSFRPGNSLLIFDVGGMTQINYLTVPIVSVTSSSFTVNLDTTSFSAYTSGGIAMLYNVPQTTAQIIAIGDINSGIISSTGRVQTSTNIPGSFINISP